MSEMSRDHLLGVVRAAYEDCDPPPPDLVGQMLTVAREAAAEQGLDLDLELMTLLEQGASLAGVRGEADTRSAYTLRFAHGQVDLLLRIAPSQAHSRIDGWIVPAEPITIRVVHEDGTVLTTLVGEAGRFEVPEVPHGLVRLRLEPHEDRPPFVTPSFEI